MENKTPYINYFIKENIFRILLIPLIIIISINFSSFPSIFYFDKPVDSSNKISSLLNTPLHLDDDTMIILRSGK